MPRAAATNRFRIRDFVSSLLFDGTTSTVAVPHNANQLLTSGFTISAWINPRTRGETAGRIVDKSEATNGTNGFIFSVDSIAANRMLCQINAGSSVSSAGNSIKLGIWQHVLITVSSAALVTHYINSSASGSPATTGALSGIITTNALTIGNRSGATDRTFDGWIDEVRIWNRVLTAQEISDLYLLGTASTTGLISEYLFNEGAGTVATDTSASANNGTITAATYSTDVPMKARKQVDGNMVKNGDFEYAPPFTAATTTSNRWIDGSAGGAASPNNIFSWFNITIGNFGASFDSTVSHSGTYSLKLDATTSGGRGRVLQSPFETTTTPELVAQYGIRVTPNTSYILTGWIKTLNVVANSVRLQVVEYNQAGTAGTNTNGSFASGTVDWTQYTVPFTTGSTSTYVHIKCDMNAAGAIMTAWFDDISLLPVYPEGRVPANGNLVKNFDFEVAPTFVAATTTAARWIEGNAVGSTTNSTYKWGTVSGAVVAAASASFDTTVSHSGTYSIKLDLTDATGTMVVANTLNTAAPASSPALLIPVVPSTSYTLTYWVKTLNSATNSAFAFVREYTPNLGTTLATTNSTKLSGTNDWTQITLTFTTNARASVVSIALCHNVAGNISTAWFDDIYLAPTTNPGRVPIT